MAQTIYDLLTGVKIDEATVAQLDSATGRTFVDKESIEFWQGILTLSHVMKAARTYPHGIVIPETGFVIAQEIADGANATYSPTGTEVWQVMNIDIQGCVAALRDADGNMSVLTADTFKAGTIYLTSTMTIFFNNGAGEAKTPTVAYLKVSL
tara:strand:+ start:69 stop:524 length:456 start_codon:yes stop_codon:yes gene_type:complete